MEKSFKRLSLALLALGLSAPAFADSAVVVPSQSGGFKVGVDALYLRATNSDLDYASIVSFPTATSTTITNAYVDPSYTWGFYAQVGYLIPCTGNDVTLGYTYLRASDTDSAVRPTASTNGTPGIFVEPVSFLGGLTRSGLFNAADAKSQFDLNAVDLELGQRFTTGAYDMRMFAGARYASINHTLSADGVGAITLDPVLVTADVATQKFTSDYKGVGPRIGVDGRYCLQSGFGIDADLSTSLLVGNVDAKYQALGVNNGVAPPVTSTFQENGGSRSRIVPVLEAKLGVDYTCIVDRCSKSSVIFEAGYQVTNYFNAVDHVRVVSRAAGLIVDGNTTTSVAFDGPYLGVKYYA